VIAFSDRERGPVFTDVLVPLAGAVAYLSDAEVVLFHVRDRLERLPPAADVEVGLREQRRRLEAAGVSRETITTHEGRAAAEILAAAERLHADLIALRTHGRAGAARWTFGSVAEAVLRGRRTPILAQRTIPRPSPPAGEADAT